MAGPIAGHLVGASDCRLVFLVGGINTSAGASCTADQTPAAHCPVSSATCLPASGASDAQRQERDFTAGATVAIAMQLLTRLLRVRFGGLRRPRTVSHICPTFPNVNIFGSFASS